MKTRLCYIFWNNAQQKRCTIKLNTRKNKKR